MEIILRLKDNTYITSFSRVLAMTITEKLSTEHTLDFEVMLTDDMPAIQDDKKYVVQYGEEYYDVVNIQRMLNNGIYTIGFSCEHVSYRLTDMAIAYFGHSGTMREILTELLSGTGFSCGLCESTPVKAYSIPSTSTVRAVILDIARLFEYEVSFDGFFVSMHKHRGSEVLKPLVDKNVVSISKNTDCSKGENSYSCVLHSPQGFTLGDEVTLDFSKLCIHENVRITGIKKQPFSSKQVELTVNCDEASLEADNVRIMDSSVSQEKAYYGVRLNREEGLTITRTDSKAKVIMNADEFRMQATDAKGELTDKLYFDSDTGEYMFVGNVSVDGGDIRIGDNFIVDSSGNVSMYGDSTIYGGRYFAGRPGEEESFSQMTPTGFEVYNSDVELKLRFGYTSDGGDYPFVQLGSGSGESADYGLIKKFTNGLWIGNSQPKEAVGEFTAKTGYNGMFFNFDDNTAYVVKNNVLKNIYTGAAIAKFA